MEKALVNQEERPVVATEAGEERRDGPLPPPTAAERSSSLLPSPSVGEAADARSLSPPESDPESVVARLWLGPEAAAAAAMVSAEAAAGEGVGRR